MEAIFASRVLLIRNISLSEFNLDNGKERLFFHFKHSELLPLGNPLFMAHKVRAVPRHSPARALKVAPEWQNEELLFLWVYLLPTKASPPSLWPAYSTLQNVQGCQGNSRGKGTFEV